MFEVHDQPDPNITAEKRLVSTVPTQALTLQNNEFVLIQAKYFAERIRKEAGSDPTEQVKVAYRIALAREPDKREIEFNLAFLKKQREAHSMESAGASAEFAALTDLAHVTLNSDEFVYMN